MARSCLARSPVVAIACESPNEQAVDLWTTLRVAHRVHSLNNNRPERNGNCVTHVVGQICYLCLRLLRGGGLQPRRSWLPLTPTLSQRGRGLAALRRHRRFYMGGKVST